MKFEIHLNTGEEIECEVRTMRETDSNWLAHLMQELQKPAIRKAMIEYTKRLRALKQEACQTP